MISVSGVILNWCMVVTYTSTQTKMVITCTCAGHVNVLRGVCNNAIHKMSSMQS